MEDFEKQVKPQPAALALGYLNRNFAPMGKAAEAPFAISRGMFAPYILIREGDPRTEPERVEVLVQQLGRYLGAVASPDPFSAMRPKLGDAYANLERWTEAVAAFQRARELEPSAFWAHYQLGVALLAISHLQDHGH